MKVLSCLESAQGCWYFRALPDEGSVTFLGCNEGFLMMEGWFNSVSFCLIGSVGLVVTA